MTTPKKTPSTNPFFKFRRSKKAPEPLFPLSFTPGNGFVGFGVVLVLVLVMVVNEDVDEVVLANDELESDMAPADEGALGPP